MNNLRETIESLQKHYKEKQLSTDEVAELKNVLDYANNAIEQFSYNSGPDILVVKWGSWKRYDFDQNEKAKMLMLEYKALGDSASAMLQPNTPDHKEKMCEIIDTVNGVIRNDWDGEYYTKEQAKKYIREYDE